MKKSTKKIDEFINISQTPLKGIMKKYKNKKMYDDFLNIFVQENGSWDDLIGLIKPQSKREIIMICYTLSKYALYTDNEYAHMMIKNLNKNRIWEKNKKNAYSPFINYTDFKRIINIIKNDDNGVYLSSLFSVLYYGLYDKKLHLIRNLRKTDIKDNKITTPDGRDLFIPSDLQGNLIELSESNTYYSHNRFGSFERPTIGIYDDCCFKMIEGRNYNPDKSYRFSYFQKLRYMCDLCGIKMTANNIFISGVLYRLYLRLKKEGIKFSEVFKYNARNKLYSKIIKDELKYSGLNVTIGNFRQQTLGCIDLFDDEDELDELSIIEQELNE